MVETALTPCAQHLDQADAFRSALVVFEDDLDVVSGVVMLGVVEIFGVVLGATAALWSRTVTLLFPTPARET